MITYHAIVRNADGRRVDLLKVAVDGRASITRNQVIVSTFETQQEALEVMRRLNGVSGNA